ncbi:ABC-2 type transporter-domain-containing protein [Pisolithus croceorrhizus]|nr:ABC-2 type transporter-domain-containing protein [Pisolithus croceorrhizus]
MLAQTSLLSKTLYALVSTTLLARHVAGQSCSNFGVASSSSGCLCPPGFGGSNCSEPACGGTIFDGSSRTLASATSGGFPNLTASDCSCSSGWTGTGCNVCSTSSACQTAWTAVNGNASVSDGIAAASGVNDTLVCNTQPTVYAAGELSCQVNNPTLQSLFPLQSDLNILRTYNSSLSPLQNASGTLLSPNGSSAAYAQLFYAGVEQFSCTASPCTQSTSSGTDSWTCSNLQCACFEGTAFCGGVPSLNLNGTINTLSGTLTISCDSSNTCHFQQEVLNNLFGSSGLALQGCVFGECVSQAVIDSSNTNSTSSGGSSSQLSGGVIAGLAVVGVLLGAGIIAIIWGSFLQRAARNKPFDGGAAGGISVRWSDVSYFIPPSGALGRSIFSRRRETNGEKTILDGVSGSIGPGMLMAILGPSGAGKTTLVELIAGKAKSGLSTGAISFPPLPTGKRPRVAFVPQTDVLPVFLTVREALVFAASLRLPESLSEERKVAIVDAVIEKLGLEGVAETRIGATDGTGRGISGGEARRVSIGLELVGCPDILVCDEPTSGLDSVSAWRVVSVLREVARGGGGLFGAIDGEKNNGRGVAVICSVHQPSSRLYHAFDSVVLLAHGRALYSGPGGLAPAQHFKAIRDAEVAQDSASEIPEYGEGYNVADYLLEIASIAPVGLFSSSRVMESNINESQDLSGPSTSPTADEKPVSGADVEALSSRSKPSQSDYATTFFTQFLVLCGREWKIIRRDKTLFLTHVAAASILGVFCGGLYFHTGITIAGFQSRVGCLFFLGSLTAFSSLSALYNVVEVRSLFVRERSNSYYSPTAWLLSRILFDVIPLRVLPTIIVSTITYWMAGLSPEASRFFKFLLILVLYTLAMTLWNFLLATSFRNGGIAILISALSALYQMTYAGFFVHLTSIPPVLRWLQWLCPLKFCLEALSVNEVGSGLMIEDTLQGVPISISATVIMELLFGFDPNAYYRDVLVLFAFIAGLGVLVIGMVWYKVREQR